MSSHQDPHHHSGSGSAHYGSGSDFPDTRQPGPLGQSWQQTATTDDESDYAQCYQSWDRVGNSLGAYEGYDGASRLPYDFNPAGQPPPLSNPQYMNSAFNYPGSSQALPSMSPQDPGVGTAAAYHFDYLPYAEVDLGHPQHPSSYAPYPAYNPQLQPPVYDTHQHLAQCIDTPQISCEPLTPVYPSSSSPQLPSLSSGEPLYRPDRPTPGGSMLDGANTAGINPSAGRHSHHSPVATSSNQRSAPGPSHSPPSSPDRERKRLSAAAESPKQKTQRRLARRHDHSASVSLRRRRSYPDVHGRGCLIPQERYRTSIISSYNAHTHNYPPFIAFNLDSPDQIGIPIIDILNKVDSFYRIRDRTQAFDMEKKTFTLRVRWPGYKSWSKTIAALDWTKSRAPITRVKLAEAVATAIRDLFEKYRDEPYDPDYAMWNVGPGGIHLNQICLVGLHQVSKGSWQPELCLLARHH